MNTNGADAAMLPNVFAYEIGCFKIVKKLQLVYVLYKFVTWEIASMIDIFIVVKNIKI